VSPLFRPINQTRTAQRVVDQMMESVREGRLKPGHKFPGENTLAAEFRVSRPCIREALRILEAVGVVEVRPGKGCYLLRSLGDTDSTSLWLSWLARFRYEVLALLEVREALEGKAAALAADRASQEVIATLEEIVSSTWSLLGAGTLHPDDAHILDLKFHDALVRASGNPFLVELADRVGGAVESDRRATMSLPNRIRSSTEEHQEILEAVKRRDPLGARDAMVRHISKVRHAVESARLE